MAFHGYEEVEHTADVALRVWSEDFPGLLSQAAKGLYELTDIDSDTNSTVNRCFFIPSGNYENEIVDFLNELLFFLEEKSEIYRNFSFFERQDKLEVHAEGCKALSQDRYIKAVTFHDLNIEESDLGLEVVITFDV